MPLSPSAIMSIQHHFQGASVPGLFEGDPWLRLFASHSVSPINLCHFLVTGQVEPCHRDEAGRTLLQAYLSRWTHAQATARPPAHMRSHVAIPSSPEAPWPPAAHIDEATVAGLLLGHGQDPFPPGQALVSRHGHVVPDALSVALNQGWDEVAIHCLRAPSCPATATLNALPSPVLLAKDRRRLPWPHVLSHVGRARVLEAWLALPGMDPDMLDHHGRTPLFYATTAPAVETLLAAGASLSIRGMDGRSAFETWANPPAGALMERAAPEERSAMDAVVARYSPVSGGSSASYENWVLCDVPSALLARTTPAELASARISRKIGSCSVEWGFVGFLAWSWLRLRQHAHRSFSVPNANVLLESLLERLPSSAWSHESLPGVPDRVLMGLAHGSIAAGYLKPDRLARLKAALVSSLPSEDVNAQIAVLPYLRGASRSHVIDKAASSLRATLFSPTSGFFALACTMGADACTNRWLRPRMSELGYDMLTSSLGPDFLAHPRAVDWLECILSELPSLLAARVQPEYFGSSQWEGVVAPLLAALDLLPQAVSPARVAAAADSLSPDFEPFAVRLHAWVLQRTLEDALPGEDSSPATSFARKARL